MKPANVLVDTQGDIRICDLGIAREHSTTLQKMTTNIGTPAYLAPEMCDVEIAAPSGSGSGSGSRSGSGSGSGSGNGGVSQRSYSRAVDIYGFAILAWQLWHCRTPYEDRSVRSAVHLVTMVQKVRSAKSRMLPCSYCAAARRQGQG